MSRPDRLKPVRDWLRESQATHVVVEGPRTKTRRLSVGYALGFARRHTISRVHMQKDTAVLYGQDPITQTMRPLMAIHTPTFAKADGHDPSGKPVYIYEPVGDGQVQG